MVIVINTIHFLSEEKEKYFIREVFSRIIRTHPKNQFIFISENDSALFSSSENVTHINIGVAPKNLLKFLVWFHLATKKILKEYKADLFISDELVSLITKTPQILISPDLSIIKSPDNLNRSHNQFYKKFTIRFLKKAKSIIVFSNYDAKLIKDNFKVESDKIHVIYYGTNYNIIPINSDEREVIKEKYAEGNEYFIYSGTISPDKNLINLLKAFSSFKKRQRSSMQLIIAGNPGINYAQFVELHRLYKFNKEVKIFSDISASAIEKVMAASYAMLSPSLHESSAPELLKAMKCKIPVIASSSGAMPELGADAALYFNGENYKDISEKIMLIFKDENLRKELIEKGNEQVKRFDWNVSAELLWEKIEWIKESEEISKKKGKNEEL